MMSKLLLNILYLLTLTFLLANCKEATERPPNVVLIFLDDGGFSDFRPFGEPRYPTPNTAQLAAEGCSYYSFYVPQAVCSASRAALLTGCYPGRTKMFGAHEPGERGVDPKFATMGQVFQDKGYSTATFGKWHIGDHQDTRPPARGFEESCGLMYSNDMWKYNPGNPDFWSKYKLQYWENGKVVIDEMEKEDQKLLTKKYTEKAVDFIRRKKDQPFFLYLPHTMPHVPLYTSREFEGVSGTGVYGDVMMELDWSVGQVQQAIKENGLEDNTIFIFIGSDNGPWLVYGDHAGISPFREGKQSTFDGGLKNACIIKYPGHIKAGTTSYNTFCSIDFLPTLAKLTGSPLPSNEIDGKDVWSLLINEPGAVNPHDYYPFSWSDEFQGVISSDGKWKLHLPHQYRTVIKSGKDGFPGRQERLALDTALFDLVHDPQERGNDLENHPEIAEKLIAYAKSHYSRFYEEKMETDPEN